MNPFTINKKIYYHDTDAGGVVYYSNYLAYFEEARTEHLLSIGIDIKKLIKRGIFFVVANVEITYKKPAGYADELTITSQIEKIKSASLIFSHQVKRNSVLLAECRTVLVLVNTNFKPTSFPRDIKIALDK